MTQGNELHLSVSETGGYELVYRIDKDKLKFVRRKEQSGYETMPMSEGEFTYTKPQPK